MRSILVLSFALLIVLQNSALAQVENMSKEELKEIMATMINLRGHLCATVTDIRPLRFGNQFEVTCIEYRGGSGEVRYIFDGNNAQVSKL